MAFAHWTPQTRRQQYQQLRSSLWTERNSFDSHWRELADYFQPRRTRFTMSDRNRGDRRSQHIIDSTPRFAARTLQSGLHAGLTSPARPWLRLATPDPELTEHGPVKQWLHTTTERMRRVFQLSNLYNALPTVYGDMGIFGVAAMAVLEDDTDTIRCYPFALGSYALGLDARGRVTTFVREYRRTVRQLIEEFGYPDGRSLNDEPQWSRFSRTVKDLWQRGDSEQAIDVCWAVVPNTGADQNRIGPARFPWLSVHFEKARADDDGIDMLRVSGFHEFPVLCPRWDVTDEDSYGTDCPGMTALGDAKALQVMQRRKAQGVEKQINPPIQAPAYLRTQKTSLLPGDITYADVRESQGGIRPIHEVKPDLSGMLQDIGETQYRIQRAFFEDLFLMLARADQRMGAARPTAREIDERHEEKLLALGPVLERTNDELLDPLVDRTFAVMLRAGLIPPPPQEIEGVELTVEYVSLLAEAQKLVGVVGQDRFLTSTLALVEAFPSVRHKVNIWQAIDDYGEMLGVNPELVRSDADAQALAEAEQQAIAQQQQAEQAQQMAQAGRALSGPVDETSPLARLVEGVV